LQELSICGLLARIDRFIRISIYPYIMPKVKITISIEEEIANQLRARSIDKYGNSRSLSQLIEDLATGSAEPAPPVCRLGLMSDNAIVSQENFNKAVEAIDQRLNFDNSPVFEYINEPAEYFVLKEVMELRLNKIANKVNQCPGCVGLDKSLPTHPDAGRNFENLYLISNIHR